MNKENLYIDINVLQTVPSSNINRDDTGTPKTAMYGGVTRSRVSSQSWKRVIKQAFQKESNDEDWLKGYRTKKVSALLSQRIQDLKPDLDEDAATKAANDLLKTAGLKVKLDKKNGEFLTGALLFVSKGQLNKLAQYAIDNPDLGEKKSKELKETKKELKQILLNDNSLALAMFGRMVADDPSLNVDAAVQVAHAISTHEIVPEFDYFTAIDDKRKEDEAGSAMLGTIEYNSSTLYRYANINVNELEKNIGSDLTIKGAKLFIKEFISTMPTGKENTFANKTVPQYVLVTIRKDTPVNLVSAFEDPVKSHGGYVKASIDRLENEYQATQKFVEAPVACFVLTTDHSDLKQVENLSDLLDKVGQVLAEKVSQDENDNA
ncbi:type I-E CRISPR-associated protein Cas7/Cse4/CasC [Lactobacillus acetotolerans]|uniref:Type I-E CRISPR-associated protein Cas7/Cse4/CasC n=1 Tax=Lactobacillus acetotolerans TaxID=1600 RepID=A0A5P5ZK15_9LACO|nr:type I-E CRISPR-associated protein Cas7/Cse4/CasC [Lactobacillus acetotolerans]KRN39744.1 crispr-associated protein [Lactobacillus acetotolerans DSM 20749 = JCM 3825]QFG51773.1 type I-E CRISPR-associated protein Cas7/Cse4/CasC [Lactobacillus acetotolerans]GGV15620.1 type I-E CRISPR-associated protein Cas7/Cse4/CasC [Lactobacillus acetotolerans DSM 20749 = JCM 3825]